MLLNSDNLLLLRKWFGFRDGLKILDVGCGNGFFTSKLMEDLNDCEIIGLDIDCNFVNEANSMALGQKISQNNSISFIVGDGYELPFGDDIFDVVISHTYLTSVQDPVKALKEKIRVAKKGGLICSVTGYGFSNQPHYEGNYPEEYKAIIKKKEYYWRKVALAIKTCHPKEILLNDLVSVRVPSMFAGAGLTRIEMHPIAFTFSLSDASISSETKKKFIDNIIDSQIKISIEYFKICSDEGIFNSDDLKGLHDVLDQQRLFLQHTVGENVFWEWTGGLSICVTGTKPNYI